MTLLVLALGAQLFARGAVAQGAPAQHVSPAGNGQPGWAVNTQYTYYAWLPPIRFSVRALSPGASIDVFSDSHVLIARCVQRCDLYLPPGDYTATEYTKQGKTLPDIEFSVKRPGGIEILEPDTARAQLGLALAIVATAAMPIGIGLIATSVCTEQCPDEPGRTERVQVGLTMFLAGVAVAPIGWILFGTNRHPHVHEFDTKNVRVAVTPRREGATLGLVGNF